MSRKISQEEAEKRSKEVGIDMIGVYIDSKTYIDFKCPFCNKVFKAMPERVWNKNTTSCKCATRHSIGKKRLISENEIKKRCDKTGHILVGKYTNTDTKTTFRCKYCDKEFITTPKSIFKEHTKSCGCQNNRKSHTEEEIKNKLKELDLELLSDYINIEKPVKFKCLRCNRILNRPLKGIITKYTHPCKCRKTILRLTEEDIYSRAKKVGITYVDGFKTVTEKCKFICPICNKIFECLPNNIISKLTKKCGNCKNYRNGVQTSYLALDIHHLIDPNEEFSIHNYQLLDINRNIDIYIPHKKLVIEIDSVRWHKNLLLDEYKHNLILDAGYNLLIIRTKDSRPDLKILKKKIHEACIYGKSTLVMDDWKKNYS